MSADTEKLIAELRAGLDGVTPGPWRMNVPDRGYCSNYLLTDAPEFAPIEGKYPWRHLIADFDDCERGEINAAFVALLHPDNILALLDRIASLEAALAEAREAKLWNNGYSVWGDDGEFCIEWRGRAVISIDAEHVGYALCDGENWLPGTFEITKEPIKAADEINAAIRRAAALSSSKQKDGGE